MESKISSGFPSSVSVIKDPNDRSLITLQFQRESNNVINNNTNIEGKHSENVEEDNPFRNKETANILNTQIAQSELQITNQKNQSITLNSSFEDSLSNQRKIVKSIPFLLSLSEIKKSNFICKNCNHENIKNEITTNSLAVSTKEDNQKITLDTFHQPLEISKTYSKKNSIFSQCYHLLAWLEKSYKLRSHTIKRDVAQSIGESKKTMDDYLKCMRRGIAFNYDFVANKFETFGHLRNFLDRKEQSLGRDQFKMFFTMHKNEIKIPEVINKIKEIIH